MLDLATEFSRSGHQVGVITLTKNEAADQYPFQVVRRPDFFKQIQLMRAADVVLQFNVSLKGIIPWLFARRPLVVSHQTANTADWRGRLKTWVANQWTAKNIGCSSYMAHQFRNSVSIPNPYNSDLFRTRTPWEKRAKDLVFLGRLVSDKGADLLLRALAELQKEGLKPGLTIVGQGPEEIPLRRLTKSLGLENQVEFAGLQRGETLVHTLNAHRILVAPSIWEEPFGIVALEGIACGCWVIGSSGGGLPEAIGSCGISFPNNDLARLTDCLRVAMLHPESSRINSAIAKAHLERHRRPAIAAAYLSVLEKAIRP